MKPESRKDLYQIVTDKIIEKLSSGVCPWRKGWSASDDAPRNWEGRLYRGMNWFLLSCNEYGSNVYLTFRKAQELGGKVKKGEKGHIVTFWKFLLSDEVSPRTGKAKQIPMLRHFIVFNEEQCEGLPERPQIEKREFVPSEECERIVEEMPQRPPISEDGRGRCFYRPSTDSVHMSRKDSFATTEGFYSVLFHELAHSTGHKSRLDRHEMEGGLAPFGSEKYSREELVAEMTSAFLCAQIGIDSPVIDNQAAYLAGWMKSLQEDNKALIYAAGKAARAADFILGINQNEEAGE